MALDKSALLELLDVMRSADGGDLMRRLLKIGEAVIGVAPALLDD